MLQHLMPLGFFSQHVLIYLMPFKNVFPTELLFKGKQYGLQVNCLITCIIFMVIFAPFCICCSPWICINLIAVFLFVLIFRTEQYFGSPSDMASTAEHIRDRMKLVSLKRQQLRHPEMMTTES